MRVAGDHRSDCEPGGGRRRGATARGCGLYAAHLPLDLYPEVGNNAELARLLGLKALARHLAERFRLETRFLDLPPGI